MLYTASSDGLAAAAVASVPVGEDEKVTQFGLGAVHFPKGAGDV